ncbi:MAG: hypothetical protein DWQ37_19985 [Planctomycetota bacterium]|nr:MAG: hypothetical protein DWQ37_19985 [Planctomycetota bacterium]
MLGPDRPCFQAHGAVVPAIAGQKASSKSTEQQALRQFVNRVGGVENAQAALALLALLESTDCKSLPPG